MNNTMTWDDFIAKIRNLETKYGPNLCQDIYTEFGSWQELAFGILEMKLYDMIKYSSICHDLTLDNKYAIRMSGGMNLTKKLEVFKKDFLENGPS